jgi:exodeoxyribonuclease VII large subunit
MADSEIVASNATEISVTDLASSLRRTLEDRFAYVRVRGEISGYRGPHSSGHVYFCLKDAGARLDAVVWRTTFARMRVKPEEGLEVVATGKITTYPNKSSYQLVVESIAPAGVGALMALLEARRRKLAGEGLFDPARKKSLPYMPRVIGVVTSPTGAVIRDILHRLSDRFPVHVLVWPVRVQGETSSTEVARAIVGFNALVANGKIPRPDLLIVARGGGSLEDLWGFNEEIVVRAAAESLIPLISAVGHETDWTLIDHVADMRAPTPTAAAELSVPVRSELLARLADLDGRGRGAMLRLAKRREGDLRALARALPTGDALLAGPRQRLDQAGSTIRARAREGFDARALALARLSRRLMGHSPRVRAAAARERHRAAAQRLARAGAGLTQQFRQALVQAATAHARETRRDALRRSDRLSGASKRWSAALMAESRRARERASAAPILEGRLRRAFRDAVLRRRTALASLAQVLGAVGYRNVLARGYALIRDETGAPLRRAVEIGFPQSLRIEFFDGEIAAVTGAPLGAKRALGKPARRKRGGDDQASLF